MNAGARGARGTARPTTTSPRPTNHHRPTPLQGPAPPDLRHTARFRPSGRHAPHPGHPRAHEQTEHSVGRDRKCSWRDATHEREIHRSPSAAPRRLDHRHSRPGHNGSRFGPADNAESRITTRKTPARTARLKAAQTTPRPAPAHRKRLGAAPRSRHGGPSGGWAVGSSAAADDVRPSRSCVRCVPSACRAHVLVRDALGPVPGAARVRAGRRDGADVARRGTRRLMKILGSGPAVSAAGPEPKIFMSLLAPIPPGPPPLGIGPLLLLPQPPLVDPLRDAGGPTRLGGRGRGLREERRQAHRGGLPVSPL